MPEIQAFRGIRYNLGRVGSLGDVVTPPYDVISPELQDHFYEKHPNSFIRIDLNRIDPAGDTSENNRYSRAAKFYKQWRDEGVLVGEADPAIYVYHQEFTVGQVSNLPNAGQVKNPPHEKQVANLPHERIIRRGFLCRQRLSRFGEGLVFPHEETLPAAKADRLMLTVATKANLSPIFGLYPDPDCEAQRLLDDAVAGKTPLEAVDHLGVVHRLWPVTDVSVISKLSAIMGPKPLFIADGHHRYDTACNFRAQIYDSGFLSAEHPAHYTLMMCVAMDDPGLIVMPTHRLFRQADVLQETSAAGGNDPKTQQLTAKPEPNRAPPAPSANGRAVDLAALTYDKLNEQLTPYFTVRPAGEGPETAATVWEDIETGGNPAAIGLYTKKDNRWAIVSPTGAGKARMAELSKDHSEAWQSLGVSLLHRLIVEDRLGCKKLPKPGYVHLIEEVVEGLRTGEYPLAAIVMPATVEDVRTISMGGERMPAKSTYFYPKLLSGLVINPLE